MSLWRKMCFSPPPWRMPSIIEAWFFSSEKITRPGISRCKRGKRRVVGDIGRGEQQRRFLAVQIGELGLELDVIVGGAGDVARAAGAGADRLDRLVHGGEHRRVLAHAEIIVGAPHRHVADAALGEMIGGRVGPAAALQIGEDAVAAFLMQRLKVLAETELVIHLCLDHLNLGRPLPRPGDTRISSSDRRAQALTFDGLPRSAPRRGRVQGG